MQLLSSKKPKLQHVPAVPPVVDMPMLCLAPSSTLAAGLHPTSALLVTDVPGCSRVPWHAGSSNEDLDSKVKDMLFELTGQSKLWVSHTLNYYYSSSRNFDHSRTG